MCPRRDAAAPRAARVVATAGAQIDAALDDVECAVSELVDTCLAIAGAARAPGSDRMELERRARRAIQVLQFHDRLCQRLGHVRETLDTTSRLLSSPAWASADWDALDARLRAGARGVAPEEFAPDGAPGEVTPEGGPGEVAPRGAPGDLTPPREPGTNRAPGPGDAELF